MQLNLGKNFQFVLILKRNPKPLLESRTFTKLLVLPGFPVDIAKKTLIPTM